MQQKKNAKATAPTQAEKIFTTLTEFNQWFEVDEVKKLLLEQLNLTLSHPDSDELHTWEDRANHFLLHKRLTETIELMAQLGKLPPKRVQNHIMELLRQSNIKVSVG